ncbi:MAG: DUF1559 domain-containing protein [Planctomycetota bacterium]|nr:DUF1559 domain-containing protein [Planctomycetota bacterium]
MANRKSCTNNQKQLGIASHACHDSIGKFPYGINRNDGAFPRDDLTLINTRWPIAGAAGFALPRAALSAATRGRFVHGLTPRGNFNRLAKTKSQIRSTEGRVASPFWLVPGWPL